MVEGWGYEPQSITPPLKENMEKQKFNPSEHLENIKGKPYLPVAWRLVWFREDHFDWAIETAITQTEDKATAKATIKDQTGRIIATAHKSEDIKGFFDYMEKAETGAVGRALALCGYGTQFSPEIEEGSERVVDSPITLKNMPEGQIDAQKYTETPAGKALSRAYFMIASHAGFEGERAKDIAKRMFKLESFTNITKEQLMEINKQMKERADKVTKTLVDELDGALGDNNFDDVLGENKDEKQTL